MKKLMTANEVIAEAAAQSNKLGAIYSRLQNECLEPLVRHQIALMTKKGFIPDVESSRFSGTEDQTVAE